MLQFVRATNNIAYALSGRPVMCSHFLLEAEITAVADPRPALSARNHGRS
jgi:hypothetical protein